MQFQLRAKTPEDAVIFLKQALERYGDFGAEVEMSLGDKYFRVSISSWGTTYLYFSFQTLPDDIVEFILKAKDIAITHRGKVKGMRTGIKMLVVNAGGRVVTT